MKTIADLPGPRGWPVVGNLPNVRLHRMHRHLEQWAEQYGDIFLFRLGPRKVVVVSELATIQSILRNRPDKFARSRVVRAATAEIGLEGVFSAEGDNWRRQRKLVAAALNRTQLEPFFPKLRQISERLLRRWDEAAGSGRPVDLGADLMRFTVDATLRLAFGVDANTLETPGPVIQQHLDKVFPALHRRINFPFPYWRLFRLPADRRLDRSLAELRREVAEMVRSARERRPWDDESRGPGNFLESILQACEEDGSGFSDDEIFANAGTLLLAGEDTTANSVAWAVYHLMRHPEALARARDEVDAVLGAEDRILGGIEQTHRLPYLDAVSNETMRLKPVAPLLLSEALADVELLGFRIPRGTPVATLFRRVATRDENFADGARFDPERWLRPPAEQPGPHDRQAFFPFGGGSRLCPGRNLALLEIRSLLALFCRNFSAEAVGSLERVEECLAFTMHPADFRVRLQRRQVH